MHYDLLVVGNGYDLACGFKTTYKDFLDSITSTGTYNNLIVFFSSAYRKGVVINDEWNGFENLLCQYLQLLDYLFNNNDNVERHFSNKIEDAWGATSYQNFIITIKDVSKLPQNLYVTLMLVSPLEDKLSMSSDKDFKNHLRRIDDIDGVKELFFKIYVNVSQTNATKKYVLDYLLKDLNDKLINLEVELRKYISKTTSNDISAPSIIYELKADKIISFNYSRTAQRINELSDEFVAYAHGDVRSDIVIGVEQSMINEQSFKEESDFIMFFKRFRRIYKNCNKNYNKKIIDSLNENSTIAIYGHSLDLADRSLLRPLFENKYKSYDIYCYKDSDKYKIKIANLIGLDLYDELEKEGKIKLIKVE